MRAARCLTMTCGAIIVTWHHPIRISNRVTPNALAIFRYDWLCVNSQTRWTASSQFILVSSVSATAHGAHPIDMGIPIYLYISIQSLLSDHVKLSPCLVEAIKGIVPREAGTMVLIWSGDSSPKRSLNERCLERWRNSGRP